VRENLRLAGIVTLIIGVLTAGASIPLVTSGNIALTPTGYGALASGIIVFVFGLSLLVLGFAWRE